MGTYLVMHAKMNVPVLSELVPLNCSQRRTPQQHQLEAVQAGLVTTSMYITAVGSIGVGSLRACGSNKKNGAKSPLDGVSARVLQVPGIWVAQM